MECSAVFCLSLDLVLHFDVFDLDLKLWMIVYGFICSLDLHYFGSYTLQFLFFLNDNLRFPFHLFYTLFEIDQV